MIPRTVAAFALGYLAGRVVTRMAVAAVYQAWVDSLPEVRR